MKAAVSYQLEAGSARAESPNGLLIQAAMLGDSSSITNLIADGANVNATTGNGTTPLMMAASFGQLEALRLLRENGAAVDTTRNDGFTALSLAAFFGHEEIVRELLIGGADISAKSRVGTTTEMWAAARGFGNIAGILREGGERAAVAPSSRMAEPIPAPQVPAPTKSTKHEQHRDVSGSFDEGIRRIGQTDWTVASELTVPDSAVTVARASYSPFSTLGDRLGVSWKHAAVLVVLILTLAGGGTVAWKRLNSQPEVSLDTAAETSEPAANAKTQTLNQDQTQTPAPLNPGERTQTEPLEPSTREAPSPPISFAELQQANTGANPAVDEAVVAKTPATYDQSTTSPVTKKRRQKKASGVVENKQATTETTLSEAEAGQAKPPERVTAPNVSQPRPATLIEGSSTKKKVIQWP